MGVSGAGKTTIGKLLAADLGWQFADADDFHSPANVKKMASGIPLTDADREPWLDALREQLKHWMNAEQNAILACSALKQAYRERLRVSPEVCFVYLKVTPQLLRERLLARHGHFMTEKMLASQLETLEEPEDALTINADGQPAEIARDIAAELGLDFSSQDKPS